MKKILFLLLGLMICVSAYPKDYAERFPTGTAIEVITPSSLPTLETDPIYSASSWFTTTNNSTDWDTAYGWGNHSGLYAPIGEPLSLHLDQSTPQDIINGPVRVILNDLSGFKQRNSAGVTFKEIGMGVNTTTGYTFLQSTADDPVLGNLPLSFWIGNTRAWTIENDFDLVSGTDGTSIYDITTKGTGSFGNTNTFEAGDSTGGGSFTATGTGIINSGDLWLTDTAHVFFGKNISNLTRWQVGGNIGFDISANTTDAGNFTINIPSNDGTNKISITDVDDVEQAKIDSNGNALFNGTLNAGAITGTSLTATSSSGLTLGTDVVAPTVNIPGYIKMFSAGNNAYYTTFIAGTQTANATYTLPTAMATVANAPLIGSTAGVLSWNDQALKTTSLNVKFNQSATTGTYQAEFCNNNAVYGEGFGAKFTNIDEGMLGPYDPGMGYDAVLKLNGWAYLDDEYWAFCPLVYEDDDGEGGGGWYITREGAFSGSASSASTASIANVANRLTQSRGIFSTYGLASYPAVSLGQRDSTYDFFSLGIRCNTDLYSGYWIICNYAHVTDVDRQAPGNVIDPHVRLYSSDATQAADYLEFFHNQTDAVLQWGNGNLWLGGADSKSITFGAAQDASILFNGSGMVVRSDLITATDYLQLRGGTNGIDFNIGATEQITLTDGKLSPTTTNDIDLGTSSILFKDFWEIGKHYFRDSAIYTWSSADGWLNLVADAGVEVNAPILNVADLYVAGDFDFGSASTDVMTMTGRFIPRTVASDPTANATAGSLGEIVFYNNKWYGKTVADGTDTNWSALN